jgi:hypothetical protein
MSVIYINSFQFAASGAAYDPDAQDYIDRVIAADVAAGNTSGLEVGVQDAINAFVLGCKADGIWSAIKASCILAGARTLAGALVPLVGTAPTNFNFVAGDYNRETGLKGDGSTKYLDSNRNNNADPENSNHNAVYINTIASTAAAYMGATGGPSNTGTNLLFTSLTRSRSGTSSAVSGTAGAGLYGISRALSSGYTIRNNGISYGASVTSQTPENATVFIYQRGLATFEARSDARLSFYSIGESLDLALLDAHVTTLMSDLAAAIP